MSLPFGVVHATPDKNPQTEHGENQPHERQIRTAQDQQAANHLQNDSDADADVGFGSFFREHKLNVL